jgi:hypothetical protein
VGIGKSYSGNITMVARPSGRATFLAPGDFQQTVNALLPTGI